MDKKKRVSALTALLAASASSMAILAVASAQTSSDDVDSASDDDVIVVRGVRQSIASALDEKRNAKGIQDSITAEDIGQLANDNISEALQRITGVQVTRSADGEGANVQIRGLSENNVQLNGEIVSGSSADRSINFQDIPAELFAGVDVKKTPSADSIEGTLGGTVDLKTRTPLDVKRDQLINLSTTGKYSEIADAYNQDFNAFAVKNFRDTGIGDVGFLANVTRAEIQTVAEAFGGGDFDDAPGVWARRTGASTARPPFAAAGPYQADPAIDLNGDSLSDENDIFYMPNNFGFFENTRESERLSFNSTLEWAPSETLNFRFDATLTDIDESSTGSRYSLNFNPVRSAPLLGGPGNQYDLLASTAALGDVYVLTAGRVGAVTNRIGASPSQNDVERDSEQYSLSAEWQATERLNLSVRGVTSEGSASTVTQGALITGIDFDGNGALNANDFAGIVDFDLNNGPIPDLTFYESPFPAPNFGVTALQTELVELDPSNINYERQAYFQFNRVANDTDNTIDSLRFDADYEVSESGITNIRAGLRIAERTFARKSYQNPNQAGNFPSTLAAPGADPVERINVQRIPVDPNSASDPEIRAASELLSQCIAPGGDPNLLSDFSGDIPRTWDATAGCPVATLEQAFGLLPIRAIDPATGVGFYERTGQSFDVAEETTAAYFMADYFFPIGQFALFGDAGIRYVETKTESRGFLGIQGGGFEEVALEGEYEDWLPAVNANLFLSDELILRTAYSKTIGRPGLALISPGLNLFRNDANEGFDGNGTAGNPDLDPVRSTNFDVSLEWYYGKASALSIAFFTKDIDSTIFLGSDQVPLAVGDENFLVRTFGNFEGTKVSGVEIGFSHEFDYLPGLLTHTGVTTNYTFVEEESDLVDQEGDPISRRGLSDDTFNIEGYYDNGRFSARLAYNWRSEFTRRENVSLGFGRPETLPEIEAARSQLDLALRYRINKKARVTFNAINLTDEGTERYLKHEALNNYLAFAGRRYNVGLAMNF